MCVLCVCKCVCVCEREREREGERERILNTKVGTKIMCTTFKLLNVAPGMFFPYAPSSDTVHLNQDNWCSSQSSASNTEALQNGGLCRRKYKAGSGE